MLKAFKEWLSGQSKDGTAYKKYEEYMDKKQTAQDQIDLDEQNAAKEYAEQWLKEKTIKEYARWMKSQNPDKSKSDQRNIKGSLKAMNKGGMPKKNFSKPGSYSSAYNKGGMGKAKVGHTDYRKGGMIYTTKNK